MAHNTQCVPHGTVGLRYWWPVGTMLAVDEMFQKMMIMIVNVYPGMSADCQGLFRLHMCFAENGAPCLQDSPLLEL